MNPAAGTEAEAGAGAGAGAGVGARAINNDFCYDSSQILVFHNTRRKACYVGQLQWPHGPTVQRPHTTVAPHYSGPQYNCPRA